MTLQEKLRSLFLLDQKVRGLESRLDVSVKELTAQKTKHDRLTRQRDELGEQHKQTQVQTSGKERESAEFEARIAKLREQMNSVKSNKEYSALLVEVNTLKEEKGKMEEGTLELMSKVEEQAGQIKELGGRIAEQAKMVAVAEAEVARSKAEIGEQLASVTSQREEAEREISGEHLAVFKRLAHVHDGETMAAVIEENRRHMEYSCGGCYISIPVERVNALMIRDDIVCCPSCGRILYLDEELKSSIGSK